MPNRCPECGGPMVAAIPQALPKDADPVAVEADLDPEDDIDDHNPALAAEDVDESEARTVKVVDHMCESCGAVITAPMQ